MLGALRRCAPSLSRTVGSSDFIRLLAHETRPALAAVNGLSRPVAVRTLHQSIQWRQRAQSAPVGDDTTVDPAASGPVATFPDLETRGLVDPVIVDNITQGMGFTAMTDVQSKTINEALKGTDIIAQAKTGTGKTIAFLLPLLQRIIAEDPSLSGRVHRARRTTPSDIRAIIISPTRELAEQIGEEARKLTRNTKIIVQTAVGGTQKHTMLRKTQAEGCHVLIGTPGRLQDILGDQHSGVEAPKLAAFVLDEADRLLDQGFMPAIEDIQSMLPDPRRQPRQTMMFSATIPQEVVQLVRQMLNPNFQFVRCVSQGDVPTHEKVTQKVVHVHALENVLPSLLELCQREIQEAETGNGKPFKAIVFFNSTAEVTLAASVFQNLRSNDVRHPLHPARILEIHSRLTQSQRTRTSDNFRRGSSAILFSSDVTARGMDFPNVTHVIQVGVPQNREAYIHRIGRTARAGKEGQGWLLLSRLEVAEANSRLRNLPLQMDRSLSVATVDMTKPAQIETNTASILTDVGEAHKLVDRIHHFKVYLAMLGVFQWLPSKHTLVDAMNQLSRFGWGLPSPPEVPGALAQRLGLGRIVGINISNRSTSTDSLNGRPRQFGSFSPRQSSSSRGADQRWDSQRRDSQRRDPQRRDSQRRDSQWSKPRRTNA